MLLMLSSAGACREGSGCVDGLLVTLTLRNTPSPSPPCYLRVDGHQKGTVEMGVKWGRVVRSSGREKEKTGEKSQVVMKKGSDGKT